MKRLILLSLLFCCTFARADLLDDVGRQLDLLEKEYWLAQRHTEGDYHSAVKRRLFKLRSDLNRIWAQLRKERMHTKVRFDSGLNALVGNFSTLKPTVVQAFYFNFKGTGMSDYTKEFRALQKEKEEMAEEENGKGKKRSRRRSQKVTPNLSNVDLIEYERWLAERTAANLDSFVSRNSRFFRNNVSAGKSSKRNRRTYKGFSSNEHEKVHNLVSEYLTAIKDIRLGLVKARQLTKIEFK
ncbi:MAG: hypothetical protein E7048_01275 [Lentisphaerae bacterium]|nr:hypothetical protein [Lentisphaerota bacterium]